MGQDSKGLCARFAFRFESLKRISLLILFVYKLMIARSKNKEKIIRENAFEHKKPGLSTDQSSNNWTLKSSLEFILHCGKFIGLPACCCRQKSFFVIELGILMCYSFKKFKRVTVTVCLQVRLL